MVKFRCHRDDLGIHERPHCTENVSLHVSKAIGFCQVGHAYPYLVFIHQRRAHSCRAGAGHTVHLQWGHWSKHGPDAGLADLLEQWFLLSKPSLTRSEKLLYCDHNTDVLPSTHWISASAQLANQGSRRAVMT